LLFTRKNRPLVGIDISSTSVKVLELSRTGAGYRVEHHGVVPLPEGAVSEKQISDVQAVGDTIRRALRQSGSKAKECALAVPGSAVITKVISMPASLSEQELEGQIQIEADQYIPYALEEVNLDFEIIGPTPENPETVDVLIAAARSEYVQLRTDAAEAAGLTPRIVDVEPFAAESAYLHSVEDAQGVTGTVALFDIGATMSSLLVLRDGHIVFTREQPFGGRQLTEEIMRRYGLSYEEAGLAKKEGGLPDNYITDVLQPFMETVVQQINRFLQFYAANNPDNVDHVALAGGCAAIPGLDELVESRLNVATGVVNPFSRMKVSSRVDKDHLAADAPSLLIACGLALRGFE